MPGPPKDSGKTHSSSSLALDLVSQIRAPIPRSWQCTDLDRGPGHESRTPSPAFLRFQQSAFESAQPIQSPSAHGLPRIQSTWLARQGECFVGFAGWLCVDSGATPCYREIRQPTVVAHPDRESGFCIYGITSYLAYTRRVPFAARPSFKLHHYPAVREAGRMRNAHEGNRARFKMRRFRGWRRRG